MQQENIYSTLKHISTAIEEQRYIGRNFVLVSKIMTLINKMLLHSLHTKMEYLIMKVNLMTNTFMILMKT